MARGPSLWLTVTFFAGCAATALLGLALAFRIVPESLAALATLLALGLAGLGWYAWSQIAAKNEATNTNQIQVDILKTQLDEQKRTVDALADGLDVAVFVCDSRAHIQYANRRACELFRFTDPLNRNLLAVTLSYELEQVVLNAIRDKEPQNAELTFTYPDEKMGVAKAWPSSISPDRVFLSVYEVTDLRRLERIRQDFVANVSHELRTPMTLIRAMAETLLDEASPDDALAHKYLNKIIGEVDRLSMISQDLLILSAAESNVVRKQVCDLAETVREVVGQLHTRASEKGLELEFGGPDTLIVQANAAQMTQVAINLVENAINYTVHGSVVVSVGCEGDETAYVKVADTGIGIPSESQKRVFERFYRVDRGRSRASGGTGLGLSIVKHIVEAHGGTVTLESALNHGSTFTARLPIHG